MFYETIPGFFISEMSMNHENDNRMTIILKLSSQRGCELFQATI